jgi:hypothetical protein
MSAPMRAARLLLVTTISLIGLGASCDDPNFGDKALGFVNDELHPLSLSLAKADLSVRWPKTFQLLLLDVNARLNSLLDVTRRVQSELVATRPEEGIKAVSAVIAKADVLLKAQREFEATSTILKTTRTICDSRETFDQFGLASLGAVGALQSIAPVSPDLSVYISYGNGASEKNGADFATSLIKLFQAGKVEEQNNKLKEALAKAPSMVAKGDELFALSREACAKAKASVADALGVLEGARQKVALSLGETRETMTLVRSRLELLAVAESLGTVSGASLPNALARNELTGAATALRGRLRIEIATAYNAVLSASKKGERTNALSGNAFFRDKARKDRDLLLAFLKAIQDTGVLAQLDDQPLAAYVVSTYGQLRKIRF